MSDLIKITTKDGKQLVSARELYDFLGIGVHFSTWMKRMCEYGFEENIDFSILKSGNPNGGIAKIDDYVITIDMAKELSMIQRTEKGKQARLYFIECEKKLKEVDAKANLLLSIYNGGQSAVLAAKKLTEIEVGEAIEPLIPKVEGYDKFMNSNGLIDMKDVADALDEKGYGRNKLFELLRDKGILNIKNKPYRKYIDQGLFKTKQFVINGIPKTQPFATPKGMDYIRKLLKTELESIESDQLKMDLKEK